MSSFHRALIQYAQQEKNRYQILLVIFSSLNNFLELENAEKRLNYARERLDCIQSGQQTIRGKDQKIESLKSSIAELERKVLHLRNAASNSSIGLSAVESRESAMQIKPYTPIEVKREQLEFVVPLGGPGTEQEPMQIDDEVAER